MYKARRKDTAQGLVALKKIKQEEEREGMPITTLREIRLLSKLRHRNIVNLIEVVTSSKGSFACSPGE